VLYSNSSDLLNMMRIQIILILTIQVIRSGFEKQFKYNKLTSKVCTIEKCRITC
jgi:hypothetical protein